MGKKDSQSEKKGWKILVNVFWGKKDIVLAGMIDKYFVGQMIFSFFNPIFLFSLSLSLSRSFSLSLSLSLSLSHISLSLSVSLIFSCLCRTYRFYNTDMIVVSNRIISIAKLECFVFLCVFNVSMYFFFSERKHLCK